MEAQAGMQASSDLLLILEQEPEARAAGISEMDGISPWEFRFHEYTLKNL